MSECRLIDMALENHIGDPSPLPMNLERHIEKCRRCRLLYQSMSSPIRPAEVSKTVEQKIVRALTASLIPTTRLASTAAIMTRIIAAFVLIAAVLIAWRKPIGFSVMTAPEIIGVSALLIIGVTITARVLASQMRPGSLRLISDGGALVVLGLGFVLTVLALFPWKASASGFMARGLHCLVGGLLLAAPASLVFASLIRRGAPLNMRLTGTVVGAISGWLGLTALQFTCDLQNISHLLVWHGSVVLLAALIGTVLGESIRRIQSRAS